jgi:MerR family transcriptional regulator, redox-sensitive transcriptional activator SoxR
MHLQPALKSRISMKNARLTIGEVAQLVGLKTSAIRYYEAVGVLPEPERDSGQRRYTKRIVRQLQVIDIAKRAGFSLDEARMLLMTESDGLPAYEQLRELANRKLPEIDALIERAQAMRGWLSAATGCDCQTLDVCALFDAHAEGLASSGLASPPR